MNIWTTQPHRGMLSCNVSSTDRCGEEPELVRGDALAWPAMRTWNLAHFVSLEQQNAEAEAEAEVRRPCSWRPNSQATRFARCPVLRSRLERCACTCWRAEALFEVQHRPG